jgi:hypothetical protein
VSADIGSPRSTRSVDFEIVPNYGGYKLHDLIIVDPNILICWKEDHNVPNVIVGATMAVVQ